MTGGGRADEIYGGRDLVMETHFDFNSSKVKAQVCLPVIIKAKHGYLPRSALKVFEPISIDYNVNSKLKTIGCFRVSFSSLAFNRFLVCHRDSYLPPARFPVTPPLGES